MYFLDMPVFYKVDWTPCSIFCHGLIRPLYLQFFLSMLFYLLCESINGSSSGSWLGILGVYFIRILVTAASTGPVFCN